MRYSKSFDPSIVQSLADIICKLNPVECATPANVAKEKAKWLKAANCYRYGNPKFRYDTDALETVVSYRESLEKGQKHLREKITPDSLAERVFLDIIDERIEDAITCTSLAASILEGDDKASAESIRKIYGCPDSALIVDAYQIASGELIRPEIKSRFTKKEVKKLKDINCNADDIAYWFREVLGRYGIEDWPVEVGEKYVAIDVRDKNISGHPVVGIPADRECDGLDLLKLIGHEIECHLLGSMNCYALAEDTLGADSPLAPLYRIVAKSDNELFYEGVAKISDVNIVGSDALPLPFATIAIDQSRRGSNFRKIAMLIRSERMRMGASEEAATKGAWTTTCRIMRGCTKPSKSGFANTKDHIYLRGYSLAQNVDPSWLNFGSMTIEDLTAISKVCELEARYPRLDAVGWVKDQLLS